MTLPSWAQRLNSYGPVIWLLPALTQDEANNRIHQIATVAEGEVQVESINLGPTAGLPDSVQGHKVFLPTLWEGRHEIVSNNVLCFFKSKVRADIKQRGEWHSAHIDQFVFHTPTLEEAKNLADMLPFTKP